MEWCDLDEPSIERARQNARSWRLTDRVQFHVRDAGDPVLAGQYDLAMALECVHDMSNPVGALRTMRQLVGERGTVMRTDTLRGYATEAGFTHFKVLPIDNFFFRFYQLNA